VTSNTHANDAIEYARQLIAGCIRDLNGILKGLLAVMASARIIMPDGSQQVVSLRSIAIFNNPSRARMLFAGERKQHYGLSSKNCTGYSRRNIVDTFEQ
jgi:hypothetical protein